MGWHRSEDTWWPETAEALAKPWPRAAALTDLRWHGDRKQHTGKRIPGRSFFASRWGWSDKRARTVIASFEWWDDQWPRQASEEWGPIAAAVRAEKAKGQPRASRGPAEGQTQRGQTPVIEAGRASRGPAEGQERSTGVRTNTNTDLKGEKSIGESVPSSKAIERKQTDPELADRLESAVPRVLDNDFGMLDTLTPARITKQLIALVAEAVTDDARNGNENAAPWRDDYPRYPDVGRIMRRIAANNNQRTPQ